jgi:dolichyl-phosphate beta-glucosyltransferase
MCVAALVAHHRFVAGNWKSRSISPWYLLGARIVGAQIVAYSATISVSERSDCQHPSGLRDEMDLPTDAFAAQNFVLAASLGVVGWALIMLLTRTMTSLDRDCTGSPFGSGLTFEDPDQSIRVPVPSIHAEAAKTLTVVFPAYNEGGRLGAAIDEAIEFLNLKRKRDSRFSYEIIIVDDGSSDDTYRKAMKYVQRYGLDTVRVLRLPVNKGKGAAVRAGILAGRGESLIFADSDGATQFSEVEKLRARLETVSATPGHSEKSGKNGSLFHTVAERHGMVLGSRAYLERTDAVAKRHWLRNFMMHGFHFLVLLVAGPGVKDTQCGFKVCSDFTVCGSDAASCSVMQDRMYMSSSCYLLMPLPCTASFDPDEYEQPCQLGR